MKKRRMIEIDGQPFTIMDEGDVFIETDRKRYSWDVGKFKYSPHRFYPPNMDAGRVLSSRTGRDIVLLTLRGCTSGTCWITWSDGMRAMYDSPQVEDVSAIYAARSGKVDGHIVEVGDSKSYGKLTVYGDFQTVMFAKDSYDLRDAQKARSILRFLCGRAVGKSNAKSKADIRKHVDTFNSDWRPSQDFRNHLKPLFECIGSHGGMYWIKD